MEVISTYTIGARLKMRLGTNSLPLLLGRYMIKKRQSPLHRPFEQKK